MPTSDDSEQSRSDTERCCHCGCKTGGGLFCEDHETSRPPLGPSPFLWRVATTSTENRRKALALVSIQGALQRAQMPDHVDDDVDREERSLQWALKYARYFVGAAKADGPYCILCGLSKEFGVTHTLERKHTHGESTKVVCLECLELDPRSPDELRELGDADGNYSLGVFA